MVLLVSGCVGALPPLGERSASTVDTDTAGTRLGRALAPALAAQPGLTGIHPLARPTDAFAARWALAAGADRTLDVQTYIWHGDTTGLLLLESLWQAAERGVRVRLLLDDNNTAGLDATLAALDAHPNLEVRLYNPVVQRRLRLLNYLGDFARVNRRMHNKSFTADNRATIVGGRNIGDAYFAAGSATVFADLDLLAVGQAVQAVSDTFDRFWNSVSSYPAANLLGQPAPGHGPRLLAQFDTARASPAAAAYLATLRQTPVLADLLGRRLPLEWVPARVISDDPAKTLASAGPAQDQALMLPALLRSMGEPRVSFDLVSPYFVPQDEGTAALVALARSGVRVRILTNGLAATDVAAVHAGYAGRREALLRAGVQLHEFKPEASGNGEPRRRLALGGSSAASLHAKTFAIDGRRVFVGSLNFDPRSAQLNTEMGLVLDSGIQAAGLARFFDAEVQQVAYTVQLAPATGQLQWLEHAAGGSTLHTTEPATSWLRRAGVSLLSLLPIEWLL